MTEGARLLRAFIEKDSQQTKRVAAALGVGTQTIWTWKTGNRRPDAYRREALRVLTRIPLEAWLDESESAAFRRAKAAAKRGAKGRRR